MHNCYLLEKIKEAEEGADTRLLSHDEVWQKLDKAEEQFNLGLPTKSHKEVVSSLRERVNAKL